MVTGVLNMLELSFLSLLRLTANNGRISYYACHLKTIRPIDMGFLSVSLEFFSLRTVLIMIIVDFILGLPADVVDMGI